MAAVVAAFAAAPVAVVVVAVSADKVVFVSGDVLPPPRWRCGCLFTCSRRRGRGCLRYRFVDVVVAIVDVVIVSFTFAVVDSATAAVVSLAGLPRSFPLLLLLSSRPRTRTRTRQLYFLSPRFRRRVVAAASPAAAVSVVALI